MKDRLIELIPKFCKKENVLQFNKEILNKFADYLLVNGVNVPPCKVGQTVYYLFQYSNKRILPFVRKGRVRKIYCANRKMEFLVDFELLDANEKGIVKTRYFDDFGKTVFLTREEAEQALRKEDEGK